MIDRDNAVSDMDKAYQQVFEAEEYVASIKARILSLARNAGTKYEVPGTNQPGCSAACWRAYQPCWGAYSSCGKGSVLTGREQELLALQSRPEYPEGGAKVPALVSFGSGRSTYGPNPHTPALCVQGDPGTRTVYLISSRECPGTGYLVQRWRGCGSDPDDVRRLP